MVNLENQEPLMLQLSDFSVSCVERSLKPRQAISYLYINRNNYRLDVKISLKKVWWTTIKPLGATMTPPRATSCLYYLDPNSICTLKPSLSAVLILSLTRRSTLSSIPSFLSFVNVMFPLLIRTQCIHPEACLWWLSEHLYLFVIFNISSLSQIWQRVLDLKF